MGHMVLTLNSLIGALELIVHCSLWIISLTFCIIYSGQYYHNVIIVKRTNAAFTRAQAECSQLTKERRKNIQLAPQISPTLTILKHQTAESIQHGNQAIASNDEVAHLKTPAKRDTNTSIHTRTHTSKSDSNMTNTTRVAKMPYYTYQYSKDQIKILKLGSVAIGSCMFGLTMFVIDKFANLQNMDKWQTNRLTPLTRIGSAVCGIASVALRWTLIEILDLALHNTLYQFKRRTINGLKILLLIGSGFGIVSMTFYLRSNIKGQTTILVWIVPLALTHFIFYIVAGIIHTRKINEITQDIVNMANDKYNYGGSNSNLKSDDDDHDHDQSANSDSNPDVSFVHVHDTKDDIKKRKRMYNVKKRVQKASMNKMVKFAILMAFIVFFAALMFTSLVLTVLLHFEPSFLSVLGMALSAMANIIALVLLAPFSVRYYHLCCHICHISLAKCCQY